MILRLSSPRRPRAAFTVVEMIVVITIILTLIGLLMGGISAAWKKAKEVEVRQQVSQLDAAVVSFKSKFGMQPPTNLVLHWNYSAGTVPAVDTASGQSGANMLLESQQFLKQMFPRWNPSPTNAANGTTHNGMPIAQNGNPVLLSGTQVLAFLLGGYAKNRSTAGYDVDAALLGFSDDPSWPFGDPRAAAPAQVKRQSPFIEFKPKTLVAVLPPWPQAPDTTNFPAIADNNGVPLAYMGSKGNNEYGLVAGSYNLGGNCYIRIGTPAGTQGIRVSPFVSNASATNPKFYNPSGFQIVSAGADGVYWKTQPLKPGNIANGGFGPYAGGTFSTGGVYTPGQGLNYILAGPSYDNICNFHGRLMGIP